MAKRSRSYKEELFKRLRNDALAKEYLRAAIEDSLSAFLVALKNVLDARKVAAVARASNLSREHLYTMLSKDGNPRLNNLDKLLHALGLRLDVHGLEDSTEEAVVDTIHAVADEVNSSSWTGSWFISRVQNSDVAFCRAEVLDDKQKHRHKLFTVSTCMTASGSQSAGCNAVPQSLFFRQFEDCYEMAC